MRGLWVAVISMTARRELVHDLLIIRVREGALEVTKLLPALPPLCSINDGSRRGDELAQLATLMKITNVGD